MTTTVYNMERLSFSPERKLLIDVNVLIYLQSGQTHKYDKMWERAKAQGNPLFITTLSISEFINYFTRTGYKQYCREHGYTEDGFDFKKDYQHTQHFLDVYDEVIDTLETEIVPKITVIDFDNADFDDISSLTQHMNDINDALYLKKAIIEGYDIVTHDSDFFNIPISQAVRIYTYNKKR
ncbi:type II toxin-antitoxin system VapC family toxin [Streptococcus sp. 19428wC2_LYSM12]|uniref:type II toxin-antitoxin system VapC family toxin n=1 Tax=unclassified Streptococcus TaxID=2608887 RepID=UPI0010723400|nr:MULTISPECIES: PIN domain-containing protein [unclassified Streptococcus]MBF0788220.1 type II toxin-antitoxin system VapC family toxin [Streptococcus sp. 19428wC2_LYSM12]TFV04729.1 type II toxin-antitoxin system VapC family toxin [Streptococcus sp. LYSM12]